MTKPTRRERLANAITELDEAEARRQKREAVREFNARKIELKHRVNNILHGPYWVPYSWRSPV